MRVYQEEPFRGLPSNQPLKSPSPDLKGKNAIGPTVSPHSVSIRKSMNQFTPPSKSKKITYMEYSTLPVNTEQNPSNIETNIEKIFQPQANEKQYSSTHAKGHYNFELPKELIITNEERQQNDLISTGKKSKHKRNMTHSYIESSPLHQTYTKSHKEDDLMKTINEKDMIIQELKQMINLMTENGKHLKNSQRTLIEEEYQSMKNQVKILTIQNQKLAEVIERLKQKNQKLPAKSQADRQQVRSGSKQSSKIQQNAQKSQKSQRSSEQNLQIFKEYQEKLTLYEEQIQSLKTTLQEKEASYEKDLDEMIKSHKSLALECKMFQNEKQQFSRENQRLINLLRLKEKEKQTCYANYSYVDKKQYESQQAPNTKPPSDLIKSESGRLSIQKIKAQYEENLKQYKQNVYNEVYNMFDTINATLEEINQKINGLDEKLNDMEKFKNSIKSKATSHLTSLQENQEETIKKSAIYIEDPPSSERISRESNTRQALSVILEESRRDNEKLELQLSQLRRQVDMWRKTVQQKSQDNEKRDEQTYSEEQISSYQERIKQLENLVDELREEKETSEKEIMRLDCEIMKAEENHHAEVKELNLKLQQYEESLRHHSIPEEPEMDNSLIEQLRTQAQSLKEELESRREECMRLHQQIADMEAGQEAKEKQLFGQIQQFHVTIKETQMQYNIQKKENEAEKQSLVQQIEKISQKSNKKDEEMVSLNNKLKIVSNQLSESVQKNVFLQKSIQSFQHQIESQLKAKESVQKENQSLKNKLKSDSQKYSFQINKFTNEFEVQVKQYIQKVQSLKSETQALKNQLQTHLQANRNLENELLESKNQFQMANLNHQKQEKSYEQKIQGLEYQIKNLEDEVYQKAQIISNLQQEQRFLELERDKSIKNEDKLTNMIKNIQNIKDSYQKGDNLDLIKEYIRQIEGENQILIHQKTQLIASIETTKSQIFTLGNTRIQLQAQVKSLQSKLDLYKTELDATKQFYQHYLQNVQDNHPAESVDTSMDLSTDLQPITHSSALTYRTEKSSEKSGKHRINDLIDQEKNKLSRLISIIDRIEEKEGPQSVRNENQEAV